jgi:hypothetical protein
VTRIKRGRLPEQVGNNKRGWVIGVFTQPEDHYFHESGFEMQWVELAEGEAKDSPKPNKRAKTMCILIEGELRLDFPEPNGGAQTVILCDRGEYVYFPPGVSHTWKAIKSTVTMTLRWPSIPDDQELLSLSVIPRPIDIRPSPLTVLRRSRWCGLAGRKFGSEWVWQSVHNRVLARQPRRRLAAAARRIPSDVHCVLLWSIAPPGPWIRS